MENAKIFRIPKDRNYTCINNKHVFDSNISELASRLLTVVLALPDSWKFTVSGMATMLARGRKAIRKAIANLVQSGYAYVEQPRNEKTGYFENNIYTFYETPEVNPHLNPQQNQEISETPVNRDSIRVPKTEEPSRYDRLGTLSNTNKLNTDKVNKSESVSRQIDKFTPQSNNDGINGEASVADSEIAIILKENTIGIGLEDKQFVEEMIQHLNKAISIGKISLNNAIDKLKTIISTEDSLNSFIKKLHQVCIDSLPNLKYPKAKNSFIRKIIVNKLREYIPESIESNQNITNQTNVSTIQKGQIKTKEEPLNFREMLISLNSSLLREYDINDSIFDNEENFWSYFEDWEDAQVKSCVISEELRHNQTDMQNILKFLMCWNDLESGEFKSFSQYAISYLAEVLQTGKCCGQEINCHNLISYLNYINWGGRDDYERETTEESICDFMECFFRHYCKQIEAYPPKSANRKGYITKMLINYLNGEYQAISAHTHACMKNIGNTQKNTNHNYDENSSLQELYEYERRYYMS